MKKLIVGLLGWAATLAAQPAARAGVDKIVYDSCYADVINWETVCSVYMADPDGSGGFILPGGQSGFPGSEHAFDQLPGWLAGALAPVPIGRNRAEAATVRRLRLIPG